MIYVMALNNVTSRKNKEKDFKGAWYDTETP